MSTRIDFWHPGKPITSAATVLLCKSNDRDACIAALQQSDYKPYAYSVSPNGEGCLPFVAAYLYSLHTILDDADEGDRNIFEKEGRDLFNCCQEICSALAYYCPDGAVAACDSLLGYLERYQRMGVGSAPIGMQRVVEYIRSLTLECMAPLVFGSPFIHYKIKLENKDWWSKPANALQAVKDAHRRISIGFDTIPLGLVSIKSWLGKLEKRFGKLHVNSSTDQKKEVAIFEASSYCGALAERHLMQGQPGLAVLLLHRAADLLLMSLCTKNGMIDFAVRGGKYKQSWSPVQGANFISLRVSLENLKGNLAPHPSRHDDFEELNNWRNILIQTHYMTSLSEPKASELFKKIRLHLQLLGGEDWIQARDAYLIGASLSAKELLNFNGLLSSAVSPVSY
jgi:hypothetical protein